MPTSIVAPTAPMMMAAKTMPRRSIGFSSLINSSISESSSTMPVICSWLTLRMVISPAISTPPLQPIPAARLLTDQPLTSASVMTMVNRQMTIAVQ